MVWSDLIWDEMDRMQRQIDRLFRNEGWNRGSNRNEMINELSTRYRRAFTNFKETENEFIIQIELPGIEKENIKLDITDCGIEIKAEKKQEREMGKDKEYEYSRSYAGFYRTFDVPDDTDLEKINASYKNGILTIKLPKKTEVKKKKIIQIK